MVKIFISYNSEDREFADAIKAKLLSDNYSVLSSNEIASDENIKNEVRNLIYLSNVVIVICSKNSINSKMLSFEVASAFALKKQVISVAIDKSTVPFILQDVNFCLFKSINDNFAYKSLINAINQKMKKKRNRVILIGNGFDLAHGLKTSYNHFIEDFWEQQINSVNKIIKANKAIWETTLNSDSRLRLTLDFPAFKVHINNSIDNEKKTLCEITAKQKKSIDEYHFSEETKLKDIANFKQSIEITNDFLKRIEEMKETPLWSGIEDLFHQCLTECYEKYDDEVEQVVSKSLEKLSIDRLNEDFEFIKRGLIEYLIRQKQKGKIEGLEKIIFQENEDFALGEVIFLNFNYKNTEALYCKNDTKVIHIHGKIDGKSNKIIFGYGDEEDLRFDEIVEKKDNRFLKYNKAAQYGLDAEYHRFANAVLLDENYSDNDENDSNDKPEGYEVFIMGHSCANCDRAILHELFTNKHCKSITYFYHLGESDYENVANNVYRIFTNNHIRFRSVFSPFNKDSKMPQRKSEMTIETDDANVNFELVKVDMSAFRDKQGKKSINDFWMMKYPVTQLQWKSIMGNNPSCFIGDDLPIENVSWNDCQKYINVINSKYKKKFRLPTEAEWIIAAQGGNNNKYIYAGSDNIDEVAWYWKNSGDKKYNGSDDWSFSAPSRLKCKTHPVGLKKPNELGLYDMSGNVFEWCQEAFDDNGELDVDGRMRVAHGGCFGYREKLCRPESQTYAFADLGNKYIGFRMVITVD